MGGRRHYPPSEEAVLAWQAYFAAGRAFQQNPPHLEEACIFVGHGLEWKTKAAPQAAKGLAHTGDRVRAPEPTVSRGVFTEISSWGPMNGGMGQLDVSTVCPIRMPPIGEATDPRVDGRRLGSQRTRGQTNMAGPAGETNYTA